MEDIKQTIEELPNHDVNGGNLNNVLLWVYGMAGIIAVAVIVYGGVKYVMSQGDPGKVKQASQIIAYAIVGLIIVLLAGGITVFVSNIVGGAAK